MSRVQGAGCHDKCNELNSFVLELAFFLSPQQSLRHHAAAESYNDNQQVQSSHFIQGGSACWKND